MPGPEPDDLLFAFAGDRLVVEEVQGAPSIPRAGRAALLLRPEAVFIPVAVLDGRTAWAVALEDEPESQPALTAVGLRGLFGRLQDDLMAVAGRSFQLVNWYRGHAYCGRCGSPTTPSASETARVCDGCGALHFPRVTPAVIMRVEREDQILLAHSARFATGFYSVLAGFVEPGETLEQAVAREVREEVGIEVQHVRYFGSQSWPFPSQLMIGFTARHRSGEIAVQEDEITDAGWYRPGALPQLPGPYSIARRLIDDFLARAGA